MHTAIYAVLIALVLALLGLAGKPSFGISPSTLLFIGQSFHAHSMLTCFFRCHSSSLAKTLLGSKKGSKNTVLITGLPSAGKTTIHYLVQTTQ